MITQKELSQLMKHLGYSFKNIDILKRAILRFYLFYKPKDTTEEELPFVELLDGKSIPNPTFHEYLEIIEKQIMYFHGYLKYYRSQLRTSDNPVEISPDDEFYLKKLSDNLLLNVFFEEHEDSLGERRVKDLALFLCLAVATDISKDPDIHKDKYLEIFQKWFAYRLETPYQPKVKNEPKPDAQAAPEEPKKEFDIIEIKSNPTEAPALDSEEPFDSLVLQHLTIENIRTSLKLTKIAEKLKDGRGVIHSYHQQFIPHILEDLRENISTELENITTHNTPPFYIKFTRVIKDNPNLPINVATFECKFQDLPELDHLFAREILHFTAIKYEEETIQLPTPIFVTASAKRDTKESKFIMEIHVPTKTFDSQTKYFRPNAQWEVFYLTGLTSYVRRYEACLRQAAPPFLLDMILGKCSAWPAEEELKTVDPDLEQLNPQQANTVHDAFHHVDPGLFFLQGPPGTGKTNTIVSLLYKYYHSARPLRIMVCAPSNQAVRLLADRTMEKMPNAKAVLISISKELPDSLLPIFAHGKSELMCVRLDERIQLFRQYHDNFCAHIASRTTPQPKELQIFPEYIQSIMEELKQQIEFLLNLLSKHRSVSTTRSFGTIENLAKQLQILIEKNIIINLEKYKKAHHEYFDKVMSHGIKQPQRWIADCQKYFQDMIDGINEYKHQLTRDTEPLEALMISNAKIIFATLNAAGRKQLRKQIDGVDILIVDEGSQAPEVDILIPFVHNPSTCFIVGDTKQLPATVNSPAARSKGFSRSLMQRLIDECHQDYRTLVWQYRMHPAICEFPSTEYYGDLLKTDPSILERKSPLAGTKIKSYFNTPCIFFNVDGEENRQTQFGRSIENKIEAQVVTKTLCYLLNFLDPDQIGVITFYKAQVQLIRKMLEEEKKPKASEVKISSVDGFQGSEKAVILISCVRSSRSMGFVRNKLRVNVAITRAQHHLFIFGNQEALLQSDSDFPQLIRSFEERPDEECKILNKK